MKNIKAFLCVIALSFSALAQTPQTPSQVPAQTSNTATEKALRVFLATELVSLLDIDKMTTMSMQGIPMYLQRAIQRDEKNPAVANRTFSEAKEKYDLLKNKISQETRSEFVKEFANRYTSTELRFLIQFAKYPLYKKFKAFMESDEYNTIAGKPFTEAHRVLVETKRKIASESPPVKVNATPIKISEK